MKNGKKKRKTTVWQTAAIWAGTVLGVIITVVLVLAFPSFLPVHQVVGVTFSAPQATGIGLDWKQTYNAILQDLQVKHLRLSAYWDEIQPASADVYDFSDLDYQMNEAARHNAHVILSIGRKLPRWPECHIPSWASGLSEKEQQQRVLTMLPIVIARYKDNPALDRWQLENEPLLFFGICPKADTKFLAQEQGVVRAHDSDHSILITDSGELDSWLGAAQYGDELGTTMYRTVFSNRTKKLFSYDYLFPSWLYRLKAHYVGLLFHKPVIISELQGEPWGTKPYNQMSSAERLQSFSPYRFLQLEVFAQRTQLSEVYWWGVEYWYWEKAVNHNDVYWDIAKKIFTLKGGATYE
ncbi:MAG: hypothetical protein K8Q97_02435 [Candidatus Andersenbacteria bacterium]|nr:hypothetical protein [Candidatus Andersenbacteria bacterium]